MSSEASPSRRVFTVVPFRLYKLLFLLTPVVHALAPQAPHPEATAQGIYPFTNLPFSSAYTRHGERNQYSWLPDVLRLKHSVTYPK